MNEIIDNFFPIPLYIVDTQINNTMLSEISDDLIKESSYIADSDSNWGGGSYIISSFHSQKDFHSMVKYNELIKRLETYVRKFQQYVQIDTSVRELTIAESWYNISYEGMYQEYHNHAGVGPFCGIFYLSAPDNSGDTVFRAAFPSERPYYKSYNQDNIFYRYKKSVVAKAGRFVMFPSWLDHAVTRSTCNLPRITVAFNYKH